MECQRFRTLLRSLEFVNPANARTIYRSLGEEYELTEHLENFTHIAKQHRRNFIIETFINKNRTSFFRPIPVTKQEARLQETEENITKAEILSKIEILLEQLSENVQNKYSGLKSKK